MIKTVINTALTASLVAGGLFALTTGPGSASVIKVTAGAGSSLNCSITTTAKLEPKLKTDWAASQHLTDPQAVVAALPDTTLADPGPAAVKGDTTTIATTTLKAEKGFSAIAVISGSTMAFSAWSTGHQLGGTPSGRGSGSARLARLEIRVLVDELTRRSPAMVVPADITPERS